ncbi:MAG TPA: DUF554 domain-containing protein [Actinomycetota bacterium]
MIGTLINVATVLAGTLAGTLFGDRLPERIRETVLHSLGLITLLVGLDAGLHTFRAPLSETTRASAILVMGAVLVGGILGELLHIERGLNGVGDRLKARFGGGQARFTEGFVVASLVFCVGPLTILGAIQDGTTGDFQLLAIKATLDGFAAVAFASALGWGVGFSTITVLVYQGALSLTAATAASIFTDVVVEAMTAAGGVIIVGIGLRLLEIREVRVGNLLPALVLAPVAFAVVERVG